MSLVKPTDIVAFGKFIGVKMCGSLLDPWVEEHQRRWEAPTLGDMLLQINHLGRHRGILLKEAMVNASTEIDYRYAVWFTKAYRKYKSNENLLDYTDLLMQYMDNGKPLDIDVMFVDEAQDLSRLQWEVVEKLGARAKRHYISGDDDQAIFQWAGADSSAFQQLETDDVQVLNQSYRIPRSIHKVAKSISDRIKLRLVKEYKPRPADGEVANIGYITAGDYKEDTFVLFRNHYRGHHLARQLNEEGIPFIGSGSPLLDPEVRVALQTWYTLLKKGEIPANSLRKMLKFGTEDYFYVDKKIPKSNRVYRIDEVFIKVPHWNQWASHLKGLPGKDVIENYIRRVGFKRTAKPNTQLMSIHQSKGREAHTVILDTEISKQVYDGYIKDPDEENRVWYVGITRAKERLFTLMPDGGYSYKVL
jgi:DNA helicase-2/ATP-dependent DNA helicase PcrA